MSATVLGSEAIVGINWTKKKARSLANALLNQTQRLSTAQISIRKTNPNEECTGLKRLLAQAHCPLPCIVIVLTSLFLGISFSLITAKLASATLVPILFIGGTIAPFAWLDYCAEKRAKDFAQDYPPVLYAMASSLKVGMTPYLALERAVKLLPPTSLARSETERLVSELKKGISKEIAIKDFARTIRLPELHLFRAAFLLAVEHGGMFVPTLQRLAGITRIRVNLISQAQVTTASMRMTANVLLGIIPIVLFLSSLQTPEYWQLILFNATANSVASIGLTIIAIGYAALRRLSNFKP